MAARARRTICRGRARAFLPFWVSKFMLQQTQVATVVPYYLRFMARFPMCGARRSTLDDLLAQWSDSDITRGRGTCMPPRSSWAIATAEFFPRLRFGAGIARVAARLGAILVSPSVRGTRYSSAM